MLASPMSTSLIPVVPLSMQLPANEPRKVTEDDPSCLGSCIHIGVKLLASAWPTPGCCIHLESETTDGRCLLSVLTLSLKKKTSSESSTWVTPAHDLLPSWCISKKLVLEGVSGTQMRHSSMGGVLGRGHSRRRLPSASVPCGRAETSSGDSHLRRSSLSALRPL